MDFKITMRGQADAKLLGQAGNFVFFAVGAGYIPTFEMDAGAAWYARNKPDTEKVSPYGMDLSAASVRDEALKGCE